jgi:membrane protein
MERATDLGKQFVTKFKEDDVLGLGAELAYRFLFALFPFVIFLAALGGFVASWLGIANPAQQAIDALGENLPPELAATVQPEIDNVLGQTQPGLLSFGAILALWAATGGTNALIKAMNRAYEVEDQRGFVARYAIAIGLTLLAAAGVIGSFAVIVGGTVMTQDFANQLGIGDVAWTVISLLRYPLVLGLLIVAVAILYRVAPAVKASWRYVFLGAAIFSVAWLVATAAFAFYIANFGNYASTYGALAGVIILMLWFYLSALVLVTAAELVAILSNVNEPEKAEEERRKAAGRGAQAGGSSERVAGGAVAMTSGQGEQPPRSGAPGGEVELPPGSALPYPPRRVRRPSPLMPAAIVAVATAIGAFVGSFLAPRDAGE